MKSKEINHGSSPRKLLYDSKKFYGFDYQLEGKLRCAKFKYSEEERFLDRLSGKDLRFKYFQRHGFKKPILVLDSKDLGLCMPPVDFQVVDILQYIDPQRYLDVMDVRTHRGEKITLENFVAYFTTSAVTGRSKLLNLLSLEFSNTKLSPLVIAPTVVRQIDWIDLTWPAKLKLQQVDSTNSMAKMKYPKVQKYCLLSVAGCYTDFHIDLGGTSVWYHIFKGEKIFWLIPPTDNNLLLFQEWTLTGRQHSCFFGDLADDCVRVRLKAGSTFFIPSGWIHAVYTPVDSMVFGGNFLHSYAIAMQLNVYEIETNTRVSSSCRFPFFLDILWYTVERYVALLAGRRFLAAELVDSEASSEASLTLQTRQYLTSFEIDGLCLLYDWLNQLLSSRKSKVVPPTICNPAELLDALKTDILERHSVAEHPLAANQDPLFLASPDTGSSSMVLKTEGPSPSKLQKVDQSFEISPRPSSDEDLSAGASCSINPAISAPTSEHKRDVSFHYCAEQLSRKLFQDSTFSHPNSVENTYDLPLLSQHSTVASCAALMNNTIRSSQHCVTVSGIPVYIMSDSAMMNGNSAGAVDLVAAADSLSSDTELKQAAAGHNSNSDLRNTLMNEHFELTIDNVIRSGLASNQRVPQPDSWASTSKQFEIDEFGGSYPMIAEKNRTKSPSLDHGKMTLKSGVELQTDVNSTSSLSKMTSPCAGTNPSLSSSIVGSLHNYCLSSTLETISVDHCPKMASGPSCSTFRGSCGITTGANYAAQLKNGLGHVTSTIELKRSPMRPTLDIVDDHPVNYNNCFNNRMNNLHYCSEHGGDSNCCCTQAVDESRYDESLVHPPSGSHCAATSTVVDVTPAINKNNNDLFSIADIRCNDANNFNREVVVDLQQI